jgi:hypothetical protein
MKKEQSNITLEPAIVAQRIFIIRKQKVMLDFHLAEMYQVTTGQLNQQIKRNIERFPSDFMFQLTSEEVDTLNLSQFVIGSQKHRSTKLLPYAFTEHGVSMLSSVLRSERAVQMNIFIIRAFVKIRELLATNKDLAYKLEEIERRQLEHDGNLAEIYAIVKQLIDEPVKKVGKIGFQV